MFYLHIPSLMGARGCPGVLHGATRPLYGTCRCQIFSVPIHLDLMSCMPVDFVDLKIE